MCVGGVRGGMGDMRRLPAAALFRVVQAALVPVGTAGYFVVVPKLLLYAKRTAVSATILASLYARAMQHRLGTRRDEPAARLLGVMPNVSRLGLALETTPTVAAHLLTGHVPRIYRYPYNGSPPLHHHASARTSFYDAALRRHLPGIKQLVILGAGFDTRAFRLAPGDGVRCFEIDQPRTQAFKLNMLKAAGLAGNLATYVAADFETEDWYGKLLAAGYDPGRPTFFLWEAVTMYLDRDAVDAALRRIAGAAAGSVVAFDYLSATLIASGSPYMRYARAATNYIGEPMTFGIDTTPPARTRAAEFLTLFGLELEEHRSFGRESRRRPVPAGFVTATVPGPARV